MIKTLIYEIDSPEELAAGIRGFSDRINIIVESGEPGGEDGEFAQHMRQSLIEWYDGASVSDSKEMEEENFAALKTKCAVLEEERHVLKSEGDWLRERLHEVQTKMNRAVAEIRDLEKIAKNTPPIPTLQEFGLFRDAVFAAVKRIE